MQTALASVLKYPGSKWKMADWIIEHMPRHTSYLEPFFGSGAVFFRKPPVENETISDIDGDVINLFRVIRDHPDDLAYLVEMTPWSRFEFESIQTSATDKETFIHTGDPLEDARRFLVRCWMAYGGKTDGKVGWACNIRPNSYGSIVKRWNKMPENILAAVSRLKNAHIECQPALKLIRRHRYPEVLIYCDPPYVRSTLSQRHYKHMMTDKEHQELLKVLIDHPGPVLLSGYHSKLYDNLLGNWHCRSMVAYVQGYKAREEVLWINPIVAGMINGVFEFEFA